MFSNGRGNQANDFQGAAENSEVNLYADVQNDIGSTAKQFGLLSLDFDLPESGTESHFIRTGGNPRLTLKVRDTKQVYKSYGWIWAAVCLLLFFLIRRSLLKSPTQIAKRLLWSSFLLTFAGWVFLPEIPSIACLIATGLFAITIAALAIRETFSKPVSA